MIPDDSALEIRELSLSARAVAIELRCTLIIGLHAFTSISCHDGFQTSAFLRAVWGIDDTSTRHVEFQHRELSLILREPGDFASRAIIPVFGTDTDFGGLTVRESLFAPLISELRSAQERASILDRVLSGLPALVRLAGQLEETLSGGERRQLAIARAWALLLAKRIRSPGIGGLMVLEEPVEGLHRTTTLIIERLLEEIHAEGIGICVFARDLTESWSAAAIDIGEFVTEHEGIHQ